MPDKVITSVDEVTTTWLTAALSCSSALTHGEVASIAVTTGRGSWSTNLRLNVQYVDGSQGSLPQSLFLKMVNTNLGDESFGPSEVTYYTRDYAGVEGAPLVHCYHAAFSEELQRYHVLLDDLSDTHIEATKKAPSLEYGLALAEGLAAMHARWWGSHRFTSLGATMHTANHIRRYIDICESGVEPILHRFPSELKPRWPDELMSLYKNLPQVIIARTQDDNGFTLIHGDAGPYNILIPKDGDRPIYILDRQPFDWSLTTWLGVYDLAYALVLDWEVELRRRYEIAILRHYHEVLIKIGITGYTWEQLWMDYKCCAAMCVFIATEYFRGDLNNRWVSIWLLRLHRSLTAYDDFIR